MTNAQQLNEILDTLTLEVAQGVTLKTIRRRLERHTNNEELLNKLIRIVEIRAKELGA